MAGETIITGINGRILTDNRWQQPTDPFENHIEVVKFTLVAFILENGEVELWPEIVIGNDSESPVKIDSVDIGFKDPGPEPKLPLSRHGQRRGEDSDEVYLYEEASDAWKSQYEGFDQLPSTHPIFRSTMKNGDSRNMSFISYLGGGENLQSVVTTPVRFDVENVIEEEGEPDNVYRFHNFTTLGGGETPPLLTKHSSANQLNETELKGEAVDTISFTMRWNDDRLVGISDDISFHFKYSINSMIGTIRHCYAYYVPPDGAVLFESTSENQIVEFYPRETHWTFKEWDDKYDVERAGSGEMLRSKVKNNSYIFNSGIYGFPKRRPVSMSLRFIYAITAGLAASNFISNQSIRNGGILLIILLILSALTYWTFLPYSFRSFLPNVF